MFYRAIRTQWVRQLQKRNFGSWMSPDFVVLVNSLGFNPIPTGLGHVTLIYGLIPPMAGRNRVKHPITSYRQKHFFFLKLDINRGSPLSGSSVVRFG